MRVIDAHAHIISPDAIAELQRIIPDAAPRVERRGDETWIVFPNGRESGPIPVGMMDVPARLADMDAAGITTQLLSPPPPFFGYRLAPDEARVALFDEGIRTAAGPVHIPARPDIGMRARVCVPLVGGGRRLGYLWHIRRTREAATDVLVHFEDAAGGGSRIRIEHTGWERLGDEGPSWRDANRGGWDGLLPHFRTAAEEG